MIKIIILAVSVTVSLGYQINTRIIGGRPANEVGKFPYQVAFTHKMDETELAFCGGAIIDNSWIITAAQCWRKLNDDGKIVDTLTSIYMAKVVVGGVELATEEADEFSYEIDDVFPHPGYHPNGDANDIALVKVEGDLLKKRDQNQVQPEAIDLNEADIEEFFNKDADVTGYGYTRAGDDTSKSDVLMHTTVKVLEPLKCKNEGFADFVGNEDKEICAGNLEGGRDSCQGDSGGPLVFKKGGKNVLIGIVCDGPAACGSASSPAIYTKVSYFVKNGFIKDVMSKHK